MSRTANVLFGVLGTVLLLGAAAPQESPTINENGSVNFVDHVGIDQKLGDEIDLELEFVAHDGNPVKLGEVIRRRPAIVVLAYYECPMLCTLVLNGLLRSLRSISGLDVGTDFDVVVVSIDPGETTELAAQKRDSYIENYDRDGSGRGWHFLVGEEDAIRALADDVGFRYVYDEESDEYAHASGVMIVTDEGKLSGYFYGVEYIAKDLKLGLVEASDRKIGSLADQVLLLCYQYDPSTGKYGMAIMTIVRFLGLLTVGVMGGFIVRMMWRERRAAAQLKEAHCVD